MPKTHTFTENSTGSPTDVVLEKIKSFHWSDFSECTIIEFIDDTKIGVSESVEEVRRIINDA